jgi:bifunctional ADP-heptose synthase (sugar kinase/adenylyltransferase)
MNPFVNDYPEATKIFLRQFKKQYKYQDIKECLSELEPLKVLIIGEGIIDEYHYCEPMGKAGKANLIVNKYLNQETFIGGAFAIANNVAGLVSEVHLVSLLGEVDSREDFIQKKLMPNVKPKFFCRSDGPTIVKKRYIHQYMNQKLFEINFINDRFIEGALEDKIVAYLDKVVHGYDLVLLSDFGHGFISSKIYKVIEENSKVLAINTQTNGANSGHNLITKYHNPDFVCLDEAEIRLAAQSKYNSIDEIVKEIRQQINAKFVITTLGKQGSIGIDSQEKINRTPIFSTHVIDTIGAGDAYFSFTAPCVALGIPLDLVSFVGNVVGGLAVQIVGNKKPVEKLDFLKFVKLLVS